MEGIAHQRPHKAGELQGEQEKVPQARYAGWFFQPKRPEMDGRFRSAEPLLMVGLVLILFEGCLGIQGLLTG